MITSTPNEVVKPIHPDRMPVILPPEAWETWMSGAPDAAFELLKPYPADGMRIARSGLDEKSDPMEAVAS